MKTNILAKILLIALLAVGDFAMAQSGTDVGGGGGLKEAQYKNIGYEVLDILSKNKKNKIAGINLSDLRGVLEAATVKYVDNDRVYFNNEPKDAVYLAPEDLIKVSYTFYLEPNLFLQRQNVIHEGLRRMKALGKTMKSDDSYAISREIVTVASQVTEKSGQPMSHLPPGWSVMYSEDPRYNGQQEAINTCLNFAQAYLEKYKFVRCEPTLKKENKVINWSDVVYEERFAGVTRSYSKDKSSGSSVWSGLTRVFVSVFGAFAENGDFAESWSESRTSYDETAVILKVPVTKKFRDEFEVSAFGFRLLVSEPLIKNPNPDGVLFDSREQLLFFDDAQESLKVCSGYVMDLRKFDYEAHCENIVDENGRIVFVIVGKNKFLTVE